MVASGISNAADFPPSASKNIDIEGATYSCSLSEDPSKRGLFFAEAEGLGFSTAPDRDPALWDCQQFTLKAYHLAKDRCTKAGYKTCGGPWKKIIPIANEGGAETVDVMKFDNLGDTSYCLIRVSVQGE